MKLVQTGTAVPHISPKQIKSFEFKRPPAKDRILIGQMMNSLDSKIHLNQQTNQTLEQMAQALFKSWFVDFDPVIDNALAAGITLPAGLQHRVTVRKKAHALQQNTPKLSPLPKSTQALFPNEFEHCGDPTLGIHGWIPKGWRASNLSNVAEAISGYAFKSKDFSEQGIKVVKIKNIKSDKTIDLVDVQKVPTAITQNLSKDLLKDGHILMAMTGATVGKIGVVVNHESEMLMLNQRVCRLVPKINDCQSFIFSVLNRTFVEDFIQNSAQGSAQPNISAKEILSIPVIVPEKDLIQKFEELTLGTYKKRIELLKQSSILSKIRDSLLPKLISGQITLSGSPPN